MFPVRLIAAYGTGFRNGKKAEKPMTSYERWLEKRWLEDSITAEEYGRARCYLCGSVNVVNRVDEDASTGYRDEVPWCLDHNGRAD